MLEEESLRKAENEYKELQKEIKKLAKAYMSEKERQAHDEAAAAIEVARNKYREAQQAGNMRMFLEWVNDTYVPADKKKALPEQQDGEKGDYKFGRWIV